MGSRVRIRRQILQSLEKGLLRGQECILDQLILGEYHSS